MTRMIAQFYSDNSIGYRGIDEYDSKVLLEQKEDEQHCEFIDRVEKEYSALIPSYHYGVFESFDVKVNDPDPKVRAKMAKRGYGLDKLIKDNSLEVKLALVSIGYCLDVLSEDNDPRVRMAIAKDCKLLDKLSKDEDPEVREMANAKLKFRNKK